MSTRESQAAATYRGLIRAHRQASRLTGASFVAHGGRRRDLVRGQRQYYGRSQAEADAKRDRGEAARVVAIGELRNNYSSQR